MRKISYFIALYFSLLSQLSYGMVKCPFCAFSNEDGALFCEQCKSDISNVQPMSPTSPTTIAVAAPVAELFVGCLSDELSTGHSVDAHFALERCAHLYHLNIDEIAATAQVVVPAHAVVAPAVSIAPMIPLMR